MQHANTVPNIKDMPPATEREWLAASLGSGASMLLRIKNLTVPAGQSYGYVQIPLPENSMLCAANTIVASFFEGEGKFDSTQDASWASAVTDYGQLISNTASRSPYADTTNLPNDQTRVPYQSMSAMSQAKLNELKDYMHIIDGITLQPGTWGVNTDTNNPKKLMSPDLSKRGVIRLKFSKDIAQTTLLLTGFTNRAIVAGETGFPIQQSGTSISATDNPQNGDFLGPEAFPWANKIIFSVPSSFMHYFFETGYARRIQNNQDNENPTYGSEIIVDDTAIIDLKSSNAASYYRSNDVTAVLNLNVTKLNTLGEGVAALTLYSRRGTNGPSALYESLVDETGQTKMYPVDVVVPGTVKMYTFGYEELSGLTDAQKQAKIKEASKYEVPNSTKTRLNNLENIEWGNLGFARRWADFVIFQRNTDGEYLPVANTENDGTLVTNTVGKKSTKSLAMEDSDGKAYNVSTYPEAVVSPKDDNIWWVSLIAALHNNQGIDILGTNMKEVKKHLPDSCIQFPNGLRLYISSTPPKPEDQVDGEIPVGSIGIGWTE